MKILVFGSGNDATAWKVAGRLEQMPGMRGIEFVKTGRTEDLMSCEKSDSLVIMDSARGIKKPVLLDAEDLRGKSIITSHDFDIGLVIKLLHRMKKIQNLKLIGIPKNCRDMEGFAKRTRDIILDIHANST